MIRIQGLKGCCEGEAFEYPEETVVLGRSSSCELVLDDASCSRQHACIELCEDGYRIRDLGSTNGVKVNGKKAEASPLLYGDRFSLGRNLFIFLGDVTSLSRRDDDDPDCNLVDSTIAVMDVETRLTQNLSDLSQFVRAGTSTISSDELDDLQRTHRQMHFIYRVSRAINTTLEQDGLFAIIMKNIFDEFQHTDRISIFLTVADDPTMVREVKTASRTNGAKAPVSQSILRRVERERIGVLAGNAAGDLDFDGSMSIQSQQLRSFMCVPLVIDVKYLGAIYVENSTKVFSFSESDLELLTVLANQAATAISNALLYEQLQVSFYETVRSLSNALEAKDKYTRGHSDRVSRYAVGIGKQLGLDSAMLHTLRFAAELHDIGKIAIKEAIIDKSSKLTEEEYETVKKHPELGVDILRPIRFLKPVLPIILHHHERYDGTGYPNGMRGDSIPLGARILNLADAFDAMTTQRPYNKPMSLSEALDMCRREGGASFDPDCVEALIRFLDGEEETMLLSSQVQIGVDL